jgi:hypothetical protein
MNYLTQVENVTAEWKPARIVPSPGDLIIALSHEPLHVALGRYDHDRKINRDGSTELVRYLDEIWMDKKGNEQVRRWVWQSFDLWTDLPQ